jgi:hypothetical protein
VLLQWHGHIKQRRLESLIHIYDVNRQLISQGFDHPELFKILEDEPDTDPLLTRRYLQLWLNQLALIHRVHRHGLFNRELQSSMAREVREFMTLTNMREQWKEQRTYFPKSFRRFVDHIIQSS